MDRSILLLLMVSVHVNKKDGNASSKFINLNFQCKLSVELNVQWVSIC